MAQKRASRGRPRKSTRAATGFPATRRKKVSVKAAVALTTTPPPASTSNEPTSAFEALCQVTSAEYERLNHNNTTNCDNRSDSSSKSTEENRHVISTPSDIQLPAWYGANIAPSKPYKNELILPPKKKKYLHYLAEADDDNQIINNPFPQHEVRPTAQESPVPSTTPSPNLSLASSAVRSYGVVPLASHHHQSGMTGSPPEQLAPLKFNPTPAAASSAARCQDTKTFSDVLDEHISRLIIQNDVIVSKQPAVVMSKRGRSRESVSGESAAGREATRTPVAQTSESMVKTLLSSKITRKTMLKENAIVRPSGSSFSYLNPENSAIKDLLIKTYEEKSCLSVSTSNHQSVSSGSTRDSPDYPSQQQRQFKPPSTTPARTGPIGIVYRVVSDQRSGALVVPDLRDCSAATASLAGWTVSPGMEWVTIDERGKRRVRPSETVYPETASYQAVAPSPGRSLRSPSMDSLQSSESMPSSASFPDSRRVQSSGTFQPYRIRGTSSDLDSKMPPPSALLSNNPASVVRTAGIFHPGSQFADGRVYSQDFNVEGVPESHEKTLNALRGHLTGRRPVEEAYLSAKSGERSIPAVAVPVERSSLPPKKRKSFHVPEELAVTPAVIEPVLALEPISPASPLDETRRRQTVIQEPSGFSGYATYVNESHASHLGFYSDLSRQYSTNVAFAQTLLQQGHYYPSFRYSCVTSNSIRGGRPIHVPNGESVSMYANWTSMPSVVNPTIRVDSSIYGKKKTDGSYYSLAAKRSMNISATSVETYTRKRQLILSGLNSFLPGEAARLAQNDLPVVRSAPQYENGLAASDDRFSSPRVLPATTGRLIEGIKVEDVSEDEEEEEVACGDCGRRVLKPAVTTGLSDAKLTCAHCFTTSRSRAETFPKQTRPTPQSRRHSEAVSRREPNSSDQAKKQPLHTEKPLMAQLKQKIINHQQPGPSTSVTSVRADSVLQQSQRLSFSHADLASSILPALDPVDLSVRKPAEISDWRTMEGASNRFPCLHCPKVFNKEGQLYLHSRVHEMETTGKAERRASKARSERCSSPGSLSATNENPRPFFCAECNVGFRIHGHLQKHLRSKGHITQLECLNRLPCGFYAELERQNMIAKLHTIIDTADCAKAFTCLTQLAKTVIVGGPVEEPVPVTVVSS